MRSFLAVGAPSAITLRRNVIGDLGRLRSFELRHCNDALGNGVNWCKNLVILGPAKLSLLDQEAGNSLGMHSVQLKKRGLISILNHGRVAKNVKTAKDASVLEGVFADSADHSGTIRLRDRRVLRYQPLNVLGLGDALEVILRSRQVSEVDGISGGMANDNHAR
jgi:hypothetical protein